MSYKNRYQNRSDKQTEELNQELISLLEKMCGEYLHKGILVGYRRYDPPWDRTVKRYGTCKYGNTNKSFSEVVDDIHKQFDEIAKLFEYNRDRERPCDLSRVWITWQDIEDKIQSKTNSVFNINHAIIKRLEGVYRDFYSRQRKSFNACFCTCKKESNKNKNNYKNNYKDKDSPETQVELIKKADIPRNNNEFDPKTDNWIVVIDESGDFSNSAKGNDRKIAAVHIPLSNNCPWDKTDCIEMKPFCSRAGNCKFLKCPDGCLKNFHASTEKYQEIDRVVRLISGKKKGKNFGCVVVALVPNNDSNLSWKNCVKKLIKLSARLLTNSHKGKIHFRYLIEQYGHYCQSSTEGKSFIEEVENILVSLGAPSVVSLIDKKDRLDPLADAAATSWRKKTDSIVKRTHWGERGLYLEKDADKLITNFQSGTLLQEKIHNSFTIDALHLGIQDGDHIKEWKIDCVDPDKQPTYFLQAELSQIIEDIAVTNNQNQFKEEHILDIIFSIEGRTTSHYVLEHESDWILGIGDC